MFFLPAPTGVALIVAVVFRQRFEISIHFCWFLLLDAALFRLLVFALSGIHRLTYSLPPPQYRIGRSQLPRGEPAGSVSIFIYNTDN